MQRTIINDKTNINDKNFKTRSNEATYIRIRSKDKDKHEY